MQPNMPTTDLNFTAANEETFAQTLRIFRKRLFGKQSALSADLNCTQAAVSQWEMGRRVPDSVTFNKILDAVGKAGADALELSVLRTAWWREAVRRAGRTESEIRYARKDGSYPPLTA
jgi:DNA-binding transcriptional regulator YiaG